MNLLLLLAILAAAPQDELARKVDFEVRAARVKNLFSALSKATGFPFLCSAQTENEVMILRLKGVTIKDAMDKIAQAASAEWQKEERGWRLIRSAKLQKDLYEKHLNWLGSRVKSGQDALKKRLQADGAYDATRASVIGAQIETIAGDSEAGRYDSRPLRLISAAIPAWRLAAKLVTIIDPRVLAQISEDDCLMLSSTPNRMQRAFPTGASAAIQEYLAERTLLLDKLPRSLRMPSGDLDTVLYMLLKLREEEDPAPAKVLLEIRSHTFTGNHIIRLFVANARGKFIDSADIFLTPSGAAFVPPAVAATPPPKEDPIRLSRLSQDLLRVGTYVGGVRGKPSPELLTYLMRPDLNEVAGLITTDAFFQVSASQSRSLVASLNDFLMAWGHGMQNNGTMTGPAQLFSNMCKWTGATSQLRTRVSDDWIVVGPSDPYAVQQQRTNRDSLRRLVQQAAVQPVSVDQLAQFALAHSTSRCISSAFSYLDMTGLQPQAMGSAPFPLLRLHASLTVFQKQAMGSGGMPFFQLSRDQQAMIEKLFMGDHNLMPEYHKPAPSPPSDGGEPLEEWNSLRALFTERFPNGLPGSMRVSLKVTASRVIQADVREGNGARGIWEFSVESLARQLFSKERPDLRMENPLAEGTAAYRLLDKTSYEYRFDPDETVSYTTRLDSKEMIGKEMSSLDQLPKEILDRAQAELVKLREQYKNVKPPSG